MLFLLWDFWHLFCTRPSRATLVPDLCYFSGTGAGGSVLDLVFTQKLPRLASHRYGTSKILWSTKMGTADKVCGISGRLRTWASLKIERVSACWIFCFFLCVFNHLPCKFGELFSSLNWWQYVSVYDWQQQSHTAAVGKSYNWWCHICERGLGQNRIWLALCLYHGHTFSSCTSCQVKSDE